MFDDCTMVITRKVLVLRIHSNLFRGKKVIMSATYFQMVQQYCYLLIIMVVVVVFILRDS